MLMDRQTDKKLDKRTDGITPISKGIYDDDLSPCQV